MNAFLSYLLMTVVSLGFVYVGYRLTLRSETFFRLNRIYLLCGLFVSFLLPLAGSMGWLPDVAPTLFRSGQTSQTPFFGVVDIPAMNYPLIDFQPVDVPAADGTVVAVQPIATSSVQKPLLTVAGLLWIVYTLVSLMLLVRFLIRLFKMWILRRNAEIRKCDGYSLCLTPDDISPYSFFSTIFLSDNIGNENQWKDIVRHEAVHIREGHSFDILLIQCLKVFFWFNPFLYLVDRSLRETHEFQADARVLEEGLDIILYQNLLLSHLGSSQALGLSNNFNSSLIKRRLLMFSRKSNPWAKIKPLLMFPLALSMVILYTSNCTSSSDKMINSDLSKMEILGNVKSIKSNISAASPELFSRAAVMLGKGTELLKGSAVSSDIMFNDKGNKVYAMELDRNNVRTENKFEYDNMGRLIVKNVFREGIFVGKENYKYDNNGHLAEMSYLSPDESLVQRMTYTYDVKGNELEQINYSNGKGYNGEDFSMSEKNTFAYDSNGRKTGSSTSTNVETATRTGNQETEITKTSFTGTITYTYDDRGNVVEQIASTEREGRVSTSKIINKYDEKGNVIEMNAFAPGGTKSTVTYQYEYDAKGNWVKKMTFDDKTRTNFTREIEYF